MLKEKLTYLFSFCIVIENFIRFYRQTHTNSNLKARKNFIIGCRTYLLATQTYSNFTKQEEENSSRKALQVRVVENAVGEFFNNNKNFLDSGLEEKVPHSILAK